MSERRDDFIRRYFETLPPPSPAMKKAAEAMGKLLKKSLDDYKRTTRRLRRALENKDA